jgi:hypothetical protein
MIKTFLFWLTRDVKCVYSFFNGRCTNELIFCYFRYDD